MLRVIAGLDGKKIDGGGGQRVLEEAGLAGSGPSYWSEAGSAGGTRELHSSWNNMAHSESTSITFSSFLS